MTTEAFLSRVSGVRRTGEGRWVCRCPAHNDKTPSLSVKDCGDGRTVINCFGGCDTADVLGALGLGWDALFPPQDRKVGRQFKQAGFVSASDALRCLAKEALILSICSTDLRAGRALSDKDHARLIEASSRIQRALGVCDVR